MSLGVVLPAEWPDSEPCVSEAHSVQHAGMGSAGAARTRPRAVVT